ncbi:hypothetical protein IG197_02945 [Aminobacter sp. SR38]|jgi:ketosteroid isomerase-like protein|uniref:hypothetical protein n=1 Tax=Aminobacter TaxID=31988 RepID=UPI00177EC76D|nr:hypothetical protein [Aminobacter sp. SR38]QOF72065.1 hypothetical protein IG197_02945 [Aminobacter sp. SR38]
MSRLLALAACAVIAPTGAGRTQSSTDYQAIAAARQFFAKFDRGDFAGAYLHFAKRSQAVIGYDSWLASSATTDPVQQRRFTRTVTYEQPEGRLVAVEFDGESAAGDKECGYVVVDRLGLVVHVDSTRIPAAVLNGVSREELLKLSSLPGCG